MAANKGEALHSHLTVICSTFSPHRLHFLLGFLGISTEGGLRSERKGTEKAYLLEESKDNGFSFLFMPPSSPCQQHYPEHVLVSLPHPSFIFHSVVLRWSQLSAVTKDHLLLLRSVIHKTKRHTDSFIKFCYLSSFSLFTRQVGDEDELEDKNNKSLVLPITGFFLDFLFWEAVRRNIRSKHARGWIEGARFIIRVATKASSWHWDLAWLWCHLKQSRMLCLVSFSHCHRLGSFLLHITFYLFFKEHRWNANRGKILAQAAKTTTSVKLLWVFTQRERKRSMP